MGETENEITETYIECFTYRVLPQGCCEFGVAANDSVSIDRHLMAGLQSVFRLLLVIDFVIETVVEEPSCAVILADYSTFATKGAGDIVLS